MITDIIIQSITIFSLVMIMLGFTYYAIHDLIEQYIVDRSLRLTQELLNSRNLQITLETYVAKTETKAMVNQLTQSILEDRETKTEAKKLIAESVADPEIQKELLDLLLYVLEQDTSRQYLLNFASGILQAPELKADLYNLLKHLLKDITQDPEIDALLIKFISTTVMNSLNEPVNDKFIKDKITELLIAPEIMDSVSLALKEVVQKDDLKTMIGDSAIESVSNAIKKTYPRSFGKLV